MTAIDLAALETALDALPKAYPGPGGLVGVMKDGKILAARAWGYADLDAGTPLSRATRMPDLLDLQAVHLRRAAGGFGRARAIRRPRRRVPAELPGPPGRPCASFATTSRGCATTGR